MRFLSRTMLALLLLCAVANPVASQQVARGGGAFVQAGATWSGLVDRNASDLRYTGPGAGPVAGWRGIGETYRVEVSIAAFAGRLTSRVTSGDLNRESAVSLDVRLGVLRRVRSLSASELSVFAGGQIMLSGLGRIHHFPYGATEKFADIFGTLGAAGMWEYHGAGAATLGGALTLPIASVVGRTPWYGLKDPPDYGFRGPRAGSVITHALWFENPLSPRASILIDYRTTLYRDADPQTFRRIEHRVATGIWLRRGNR